MLTRRLEIREVYVMTLTFLIFFTVGRISKSVIAKHRHQKLTKKQVQIPNPKGGDLEFHVSEDASLRTLILESIANNKTYLVKDK